MEIPIHKMQDWQIKEHYKKISDEDIDVKFSTKKQLSKMDFIQRGKFQNKK